MPSFPLPFGAIESRIASISCPRGTPGRVHTLRLRRCFHQLTQRHSAASAGTATLDLRGYGDDVSYSEQSGHSPSVQPQEDLYTASQPKSNLAEHMATLRQLQRKYRHGTDSWDPFTAQRLRRHYGHADGDIPSELSTSPQALDPKRISHDLKAALGARDPHGVLHALMKLEKLPGQLVHFLATVPATAFSEILRLLDPTLFVGRYEQLHREISPLSEYALGLPPTEETGHYTFCKRFMGHILAILEARHSSKELTISDYKYLLKCTRSVGDIDTADQIWRQMLSRRPAMRPDLECHNHYLATRCWADVHNPRYRNSLRVIPYNTLPRQRKAGGRPDRLKGHSAGLSGIKSQVSTLFTNMVEQGLSGNEETFCLMITALAREGDVDGFESLLKRVWAIDTDNILQTEDSEMQPPKQYATNSPFYPSSRLLSTLAHAYGTNNRIPTALHVIDYISRHYRLPIPIEVWQELLNWTYVLSRDRSNREIERIKGTRLGQLPRTAVRNLWKTMRSEPYNVEPNMMMYDKLVSDLLRNDNFGNAQTYMKEALEVHKMHVRELSQVLQTFSTSPPGTPKSILEERARNVPFAHLRLRVNRQYIRRWVRTLIHRAGHRIPSNRGYTPIGLERFATHQLPQIIQFWMPFLPRVISYPTENGIVSFQSQMRWSNVDRNQKYAVRNMKHVERGLRGDLEDDDLAFDSTYGEALGTPDNGEEKERLLKEVVDS